MEIQKSVTINLSENDVKEIIADYLRKDGYEVTAENIKVEMGTRCVGYFTDEHVEPYFKGISVNCKEK